MSRVRLGNELTAEVIATSAFRETHPGGDRWLAQHLGCPAHVYEDVRAEIDQHRQVLELDAECVRITCR
jgi:hypothetical protein